MNWRRLGVALMLVGLLLGATGTYSAVSLDADRGFSIGAVGDDDSNENSNYFDTTDDTRSYIAISQHPSVVLSVFNNFGQSVRATQVAVTDIRPVNATVNGSTTDSSAVKVYPDEYTFSEGTVLESDSRNRIELRCNPEYNETVRGEHEITVSMIVEGVDSGAEISLDRTVTTSVECNT